MDYRATILLYLELLFALAILWREGLLRTKAQRIAAVGMVSLAFVLRYCCLTYETLDYQDWLRVWMASLRDTGAWRGLGQEIWSCNYNAPYLYILALITKSDIYELLLVKLVSIFFDVLMAFVVMRLVGLFSDSPARKLTAFIGVLWLPTVYLNGAYWGQCDVIYAFFAVLAIYLALSDRPGWSVAAIAVSISFKLQGIFLLPAYLVFLFAGKIKIRHLFVFPAVYILTILPAVLAGRDFWELLTLYYNNTSTIGDGLNYNSSSLYALLDFSSLPNDTASKLGIFLAFFLCASIYIWMLLRRKEITNRTLLGVCILFCLGVPFFLPHMHDRYFFMADVLTFALAVIAPRMSLTPLLVSFGSFLGYYAYLRMRYLMPMRRGALAMLLALILIAGFTAFSLDRKDSEKNVLTNPVDLI
ncbi:MAG: glycosyltransferase 87 family protein [Oscillospiraceae bacterium]